ncbi:MAG TPA: hypothetical protein VNF99_18720 [Stellaceae bacterium]|nr:hypothetical protein [Stellaceae bacterium]
MGLRRRGCHRTRRARDDASSYGWNGGFGTSWANDPAEDMIAILMTQCARYPAFSPVHLDFWSSAHQAIDD